MSEHNGISSLFSKYCKTSLQADSMLNSSPLEADSLSAGQEISCSLCNAKIHYRFYKNRQLIIFLANLIQSTPSDV
jgi:hypothetical protein